MKVAFRTSVLLTTLFLMGHTLTFGQGSCSNPQGSCVEPGLGNSFKVNGNPFFPIGWYNMGECDDDGNDQNGNGITWETHLDRLRDVGANVVLETSGCDGRLRSSAGCTVAYGVSDNNYPYHDRVMAQPQTKFYVEDAILPFMQEAYSGDPSRPVYTIVIHIAAQASTADNTSPYGTQTMRCMGAEKRSRLLFDRDITFQLLTPLIDGMRGMVYYTHALMPEIGVGAEEVDRINRSIKQFSDSGLSDVFLTTTPISFNATGLGPSPAGWSIDQIRVDKLTNYHHSFADPGSAGVGVYTGDFGGASVHNSSISGGRQETLSSYRRGNYYRTSSTGEPIFSSLEQNWYVPHLDHQYLRTALHFFNGQSYIFLSNAYDAEIEVDFSVNWPTSGNNYISSLDEGSFDLSSASSTFQWVSVSGSAYNDNPTNKRTDITLAFEPYEVKILRLDLVAATTPSEVFVDTKIMLHGPFNSATTAMNTDLRVAPDLIPNDQPYGISPWNYLGIETITTSSPDIVDWVLIEVRDPGSTSPRSRRAALLRSDGRIVDTDGTTGVAFPNTGQTPVPPGFYNVVIDHRNHLRIQSSVPIGISENAFLYDFTTAQSQAFGTNPMIGLGNNNSAPFVLRGGDGDRNHTVTIFDYLNVWLPENGGPPGYWYGDFNLSRSVSAFDFLNIWLPSNGQASQVP